MKNALVTGGAGAIGGNLVSALVRETCDFTFVDDIVAGTLAWYREPFGLR